MAAKPSGSSAGCAQLKKDLREKRLGSFYILSGQEDYLRRYYLGEIKKQLLDELTAYASQFKRQTVPASELVIGMKCALQALPMMADRSMVLVEDVNLFDCGDTETLTALLSDLPSECCLVVHTEEFKPDKRKKKLWEAIEKNAVLADFAYQSETDLRPWIARHFRSAGKQIAPELCTYLLQQCGLSMTRLHGEILKICAYSGAETIVRSDIDAVVEPTLEAVVFQITDALGQREYDRALERLHVLLKMQTEPIPIVAAIGAQMRRLYAAKLLQNAGKGADALASLCGIAPFAASKTMTQARRVSERFCRRAVEHCCRTDYQLKTSYDDPERLTELLILTLAEEASHD